MTVAWVTACHEAAHCVATLLCGEGVHRVTVSRRPRIVVDRRGCEVGPVFGLVETSLNPAPSYLVAMQILQNPELRLSRLRTAVNSVFVHSAGAVAEARAGRRGFQEVCLFGSSVGGDWSMSLDALSPFFDSRVAQQRAREIWEKARPIIGRGAAWAAVEAVATALRSAGHLDGGAVENLVSEKIGPLPKQDWNRPIVALDWFA